MKTILTILIVLMLFLSSLAQDAKPTGFSLVNSPQWHYNPTTQKVGMYKGSTYLWNQFFSAKVVQSKLDSLAAVKKNANDSTVLSGYFTQFDGLSKEDKSNKVISISGSSTDVQYPSAKLVYDQLAGKEATLTKGTLTENIDGLVLSDSTRQVIGGATVLQVKAGRVIPTSTNISHAESGYSGRIATFTTTGSSGASTFSNNTLNIPTYTLSGLGLGASKITYSSSFTFDNDRDIPDKAYVDAIAAGNMPKTPVEVATTGNITLSGEQTIDTYSAVTGNRVLVWNQSTVSQNGIYVVAAGAWSRATDTDTWAELYKAYVAVINGSQSGSSFVCTIPSSGTLETTDVTWVIYGLPSNITAGTGLSKTGNTISLNVASASALGGIKIGSGIIMNGDTASVSTAYAPTSGSTNYIHNGTGVQTANYNITGNGVIGGILNVGTSTSTNSVDPTVNVNRNISSGSGNAHGYSDSSTFGRSGYAYAAFDGRYLLNGTADFNHTVPFQAALTYSSSGTLSDAYGLFTTITQTAGTITRNYGGYFANPVKTGGTMTDNYGIYVASQTAGTNNYAAILMGKVGISNDTPINDLSVGVTTASGGRIGVKQTTTTNGIFSQASSSDAMIRLYHNATLGVLESSYNATAGYTPLGLYTSGLSRYEIAVDGTHDFKSGNMSTLGKLGAGGVATEAKIEALGTTGELFKSGTLINDGGWNHAFGVENGNGIFISKINAANNTAVNKLIALARNDTYGGRIILYGTTGSINVDLHGDGSGYFASLVDATGYKLSGTSLFLNKFRTGYMGVSAQIPIAQGISSDINWVTLSGDATINNTGAVAISNNTITNAKLENVATSTIKGRVTALAGDPEDLTPAQVRTLLNVADGANAYVHPNHSGDVTSVADGAQTIVNNAVTNAKAAQMATKTYKGRTSALTGNAEDVPVATLKTDLGLVKGDVGLGNVDNTSDANKPISTATQTALNLKKDNSDSTATTGYTRRDRLASQIATRVAKNAAITGATKTKITYDAKGLVTSGSDATTTDIAEGTNLYYTDGRVSANSSVVANTAKVSFPGFGTSHVLAAYGDHAHTGVYDNYNSWGVSVNGGVSSGAVSSGNVVNFYGSGGITTSRVGNDITITGGGSMTYPATTGLAYYDSGTGTWGTSVTNNSTNWNSAYSWTNTNGANAVTAYNWGNHASAGYLTSQISHADVLQDGDFASQGIMLRGATSGSYSILTNSSDNWNLAHTNMGKVQVEDDFGYGKMSIGYFYYSAGMIYPIIASSPSSGEATPLSSGGAYTALNGKEPSLGNPAGNGYVLSSTTGGTRSWIIPNSGSGTSGRVTYWNGTNSLTSDADFTFDGIDLRVGATNGTGVVYSGNFSLTSDSTLKQNFRPITFSNIDKIKFGQFDFKADQTHRTRYGALAQQVERYMPELVYTDKKTGIKSVAYIDLIIAKISDLDAKMLDLENRIKALENEK